MTRAMARKLAVVAGIVGAMMAVGVTWWLLQPPREGVKLHAQAQTFPWARAPGHAAGSEEDAPDASDVQGALPAPTASQSATGGPVAFDLCGLGRIVVPRAARNGPSRDGGPLAELPAPVGRFAYQEVQARVVQALSSGDARQRVAARMLQSHPEDDPGAQIAWARGLLTDAIASRDAQALRWAGAACPFVDDELQCRRQLVRARVQAEPANALHWLEWAHEEPEAADAAWAGLLRAHYWREMPMGLAGASLRAVTADVPPYLQSTLAEEAMGRDAAFPGPPLDIALERCGGARGSGGRGAAPSGSAAACERLARLLIERGDSVQALMLGRELGEHIGWPAEQLRRLDEEVGALQKQELHWSIDERRPLGCETVDRQRSHITAVELEGELAPLRRNRDRDRDRATPPGTR